MLIAWSDGERRRYRVGELRDACPCATCREKRNAPPPDPLQLTILSPQEAQPLQIKGMRPVGNYAYSIAFSDGDPITRGRDREFLQRVPGTRDQPHTTLRGGHFLQEDDPQRFAELIVSACRNRTAA